MRNAMRNGTVWAAAVVLAMGAGISAQQQQATTTPPAVLQAEQVDRYVVGQATPPETPGTSVMSLTLEQAIAVALDKNLDLKAARLGPSSPQGVDYQLQSARAAFLPRYTGTYSYSNSLSPSNNVQQGVPNVSNLGQNFNANYSQLLNFHGGNFGIAFTNGRTSTNDLSVRLNPSYTSRLNFTYTQPLLAGFKMDNTRNQLRTLGISRQIADLTLLTQVENTKANVRTAYWNLRAAIEQIEISKRALDLAQRTMNDNKVKVEIGTLAPIDTVQNEVSVAQADQTLLAAQIAWRTAELNFKRLLAAGPEDDIYRATINPTEQAALSISQVDIPGAIKNALAVRTDIVQTRRNLEISQLNLDVTKDTLRPQLDLSSGFNSNGQGGTRKDNLGNLTEQSGYNGALRNLSGFDNKGWNAQLNFTVPLGRDITINRVNYARAILSIEQAEASLKAQELTITADVTNAGLAVDNNYRQYLAAQKSSQAAQTNADATLTRFNVGTSTNFEVTQAQNQLTVARLTELNRLIAYLNAIAEFDRIQRVGR